VAGGHQADRAGSAEPVGQEGQADRLNLTKALP